MHQSGAHDCSFRHFAITDELLGPLPEPESFGLITDAMSQLKELLGGR